MEDIQNVQVVNNEKQQQFEIRYNDSVSMIPYNFKDDMIALFHTEVEEKYRGKGLGSKLALYALNYAKEHGLKILVYCPFIAKYIKLHPEWNPYVKHFIVSKQN